jgi:hypothetical protein
MPGPGKVYIFILAEVCNVLNLFLSLFGESTLVTKLAAMKQSVEPYRQLEFLAASTKAVFCRARLTSPKIPNKLRPSE